jgi:hypothetical protein
MMSSSTDLPSACYHPLYRDLVCTLHAEAVFMTERELWGSAVFFWYISFSDVHCVTYIVAEHVMRCDDVFD